MRNILAPHKEQDGWVYVRVLRVPQEEPLKSPICYSTHNVIKRECGVAIVGTTTACYFDGDSSRRTISSRRVEEAVETADYLKRCAEEGLTAIIHKSGWVVGEEGPLWGENDSYHLRLARWNRGATLREAYYRYKSANGR